MLQRHWSIATSSQEKSKHWTINTYKLWTSVEQTVPWALDDVGLDSASDTSEGQAARTGITNHGIIPVVQYVALFTAGFDWFRTGSKQVQALTKEKKKAATTSPSGFFMS